VALKGNSSLVSMPVWNGTGGQALEHLPAAGRFKSLLSSKNKEAPLGAGLINNKINILERIHGR
jgi:hypothetical protein